MDKYIGVFLILPTIAVCISGSGHTETNEAFSASTPAPLTTAAPKNFHLADTVNEFGYKLLIKLMKHNHNKNVVISPTGIAGLLAMTLLGSVGKTYDELAATLGFSTDILTNRKNHEQLGELLHSLNINEPSSRTLYADAVFIDAHTQIRQVYRDYLRMVYRGDVVPVQFVESVQAKDLFNDWVKNHTNGKIVDFLKDPLPETTKVVLLSALYFSGQWQKLFIPEHTVKMPFVTTSGSVMADLMLNIGVFKYAYSAQYGVHVIALPYNDSTTTMYALKPRFPRKLNLTDLMERLDYAKLNNLLENMTRQDCVIRFPKMEISSKVNLVETLKELGVITVFNPADANFALMINRNSDANKTEEELISRINNREEEDRGLREKIDGLPNPGVYVDTVLHDVKMTINEYGTEAVAVTSGIMARSATLFFADTPFYMFIRNEKTKLITFSAIINNPTI